MKNASPWVLIVVLLIAMVALRGFGSAATHRALQRAETAETAVRELQAARDGLTEANAALADAVAASDSIYAADRAVWDASRADAEARAAAAAQRASGLADEFRAQLDSVGRREFGEIEASWQAALDATEVQVLTLTAQVASLEGLVAGRDQLIVGLRSELAAGLAVEAGLRDANDALHDAVRAQSRQAWLMRGATGLLLAGVIYQAVSSR